MKTVNPSTMLMVNGERPSTTLGTSVLESFDWLTMLRTMLSRVEAFIEGRSRTIKFVTLGCKVNQYDTQSIREQFASSGFKEIDNGRRADIYVINTCTVTSIADRKSRYFIHYAHRRNPKAIIIVTGCYTTLDSDEISKIPGVTHIIKNQDKGRIVELLNGLNGHNERNGQNGNNEIGIPNAVNQGSHASGSRAELSASRRDTSTSNFIRERNTEAVTTFGISNFSGHTRAFLKIQDGCNNFCSYCKVPMVRGASRSKPLDEIVQEANRLTRNGFKEIVLCGICLGSYGRDFSMQIDLVDVIEALENIERLLRIRLSSIEASDISDRLIEKLSQSKKLCRHLHIPIQSGDDEILKKMNRNYCREDYLNLIKKIKMSIPEIAVTTDVLVGFPGEKDDNFQNTVDLIREIMPLRVHIFPYSKRSGTPASILKAQVNPPVIKERISKLTNISKTCALDYEKKFLNQDKDVLIEGHSKENKKYWEGYTDNYIRVWVKSGKNFKNQLIQTRLKKINKDYIEADL